MAEKEQPPPKDRTVVDFEDIEAIRNGLADSSIDDWHLKSFEQSTSVLSPNSVESEAARLAALKSYNILDTEAEVEFEEITKEAAAYFQCPVAVVTLVDMGRQWFKSIQGLPVSGTPRCLSFCAHVVKRKQQHGAMVVCDATKDDRFKENPLVVGGPKVRFYAGAPLCSPEGQNLGTFCVIDFKPHPEGLASYEMLQLELYATEVVFQMITRERECT